MRSDGDSPVTRRQRRLRRRRRPSDAGPAHDLGVLFVHGIGQQDRGSTLVVCGEALHAWLRRWFAGISRSWLAAGLEYEQWHEWFARMEGVWQARREDREIPRRFETLRTLIGNMRSRKDAGTLPPLETVANDVADGILAATATLRDARLRDPAGDEPSHAPLELLALRTDGSEHRSRWLLAESWWAQAFTEPSFRQLALWLVQVLPWTLGSHFGSRVRRAWRILRGGGRRAFVGLFGLLANLALLVLSIPFAVVGEGLVLIVLLFALLPIPRLRAMLAGFERTLAAILGDSLVLLSNPLQRAAMVAQIQRDVAWLAQRCKTVAVVAHSQGGALAHIALREDRPPNVKLLLTYGSGLRKLEELRQLATMEDDTVGGRAYLTAASVVLLGFSAWSALFLRSGWNVWTTSTGLLLFVLVLASYLFQYWPIDIAWFSLRFKREGLHWVDYYASADPVPNGALQDYDPDLQLPGSLRIVNERSFLRDHTTYWANYEQFVALVAAWLGSLAGGPWTRILAPRKVVWTRAWLRRRWRVAALAAARWTAIAGAAWLLFARRDEWRAVLAWLASLLAGAADAILPWFAQSVRAPRPDLPTLGVTAGALVALFALGRAARAAWDRWSEHELRAYFDRRAPGAADAPAGAGMARVRRLQRSNQAFTSMWFFFAFATPQVGLAVMLTPLPAGRSLTWIEAGNAASVAGFVVAVLFEWLQKRAERRALADAAA